MALISMIEGLDQSVILYLKDGSLLQANSFKSKHHYKTQFFLIKQINKNCLTLELLRPCSLCCDKNVLLPMNEYITIDISCLCGYQLIPNVLIRECSHPPICISDCVCGTFTIPTGEDETVIWQSNLPAEQYGFINLRINRGIEDSIKLRIYTNNFMEYKTYHVTEQKSYEFFVTDCSSIKILRLNMEAKLQGTFEVKWKSVIR